MDNLTSDFKKYVVIGSTPAPIETPTASKIQDTRPCQRCGSFAYITTINEPTNASICAQAQSNDNDDGELSGREGCPICRMILYLIDPLLPPSKAVRKYVKPTVWDEVCWVKPDPQFPGIGLQVYLGDSPKGKIEIVPLTKEAYQTVSAFGWTWSEPNEQQPVPKIKKPQEVVDPNQLIEWLQSCEKNHSSCEQEDGYYTRDTTRSIVRNRFETVVNFKIRLIDVDQQCLIEAISSQSRYLALSYVWGKSKGLQATKSNINTLLTPGALSSPTLALPRGIQDAIQAVKLLGERYLWVDALCIVQDDARDKHQAIQAMDIIYHNSLATLVNLAGTDSNDCLPGVRPGTRMKRFDEKFDGYQLISTPTQLSDEIAASTWESRGWTMQERICSRRLLYFSRHQVFFQCRQHVLCEIVDTKHVEPASKLSSPLRKIDPIAGCWSRQQASGAWPPWNVEIYLDLVQIYTKRRLSYANDRLNAFEGLTAAVQQTLGGKFYAGLPEAAFDLALLWVGGKRHDKPRTDGNTQGTTFPSWSWASWDGLVHFPMSGMVKNNYQPNILAPGHHVDLTTGEITRLTFTNKDGVDITDLLSVAGHPFIYAMCDVESFKISSNESQHDVPGRIWIHPFKFARMMELGMIDFRPGSGVGKGIYQNCSLLQFDAAVVGIDHFTVCTDKESFRFLDGADVGILQIKDRNARHCGILLLSLEVCDDVVEQVKNSKCIIVMLSTFENASTQFPTEVVFDVKKFGSQNVAVHNCLLLRPVGVDGYEKLGVVQLHGNAWDRADPTYRLIKMK